MTSMGHVPCMRSPMSHGPDPRVDRERSEAKPPPCRSCRPQGHLHVASDPPMRELNTAEGAAVTRRESLPVSPFALCFDDLLRKRERHGLVRIKLHGEYASAAGHIAQFR